MFRVIFGDLQESPHKVVANLSSLIDDFQAEYGSISLKKRVTHLENLGNEKLLLKHKLE